MPSLTAAQKQAAPQNSFSTAISRARPRPAAPALSPVLSLHRAIGNQAVLRLTGHVPGGRSAFGGPAALQARLRVQPKLTVNAPGDAYEQEADRVAEQLLRMPEPDAAAAPGSPGQVGGAPGLQRKCDCGGTCGDCQAQRGDAEHARVQMKAGPGSAGGTEAPPIVHDVLRAPGRPLDTATRGFMEPRFGRDFGAVRVHMDETAARSAATMRATAYTVGRDAVFGAGEFAPHTRKGAQLLAHELAHVGQQGEAQTAATVVQRKPDDALPLVPDTEEMCAPPTRGSGSCRSSSSSPPLSPLKGGEG